MNTFQSIFNEAINSEKRIYTGEPLESGGTSIQGEAAPPIKTLAAKGAFSEGMKVLDYGAGKYGRNSEFLRKMGVEVYSYDPFNGTSGVDGWSGVTTDKPTNTDFDAVFTSYVLNVVPEHIEDGIIKDAASYADDQIHITRNMDVFDSIKKALIRKDRIVGDFFINEFATQEEKTQYDNGELPNETIMEFVEHGVQTSKGFQRIPTLEDKGFKPVRKTSGFKVYIND